MQKYLDIISKAYSDYWNYLKNEILQQNNWDNYFYCLIVISMLVWILEIAFPWRKNQALFRKDFISQVLYPLKKK